MRFQLSGQEPLDRIYLSLFCVCLCLSLMSVCVSASSLSLFLQLWNGCFSSSLESFLFLFLRKNVLCVYSSMLNGIPNSVNKIDIQSEMYYEKNLRLLFYFILFQRSHVSLLKIITFYLQLVLNAYLTLLGIQQHYY